MSRNERAGGSVRPALILGALALGGLASLALSAGVSAQESKDLVSIQVRLLQSGAPLNADLDLTFEIYDQESGGTLLWSEVQLDVPVRNGILTARLGASTSLGNVFKSGLGSTTDRWVAIKADGDEIVPRVFLTAVPYAQGASAADIASTIWNQSTGTALAITDIPGAIFGAGLESDGSGHLRLASSAAGDGLTGGGGSALAVDGLALINSGAAAIDGDRLEITYTPTNYTRRIGGEAQSLDELAAHLVGIDDRLATAGSGGSSTTTSLQSGFRLSTESGVPVSTQDRVDQGVIYLVPYKTNHIGLYDTGSSAWVERTSAQVSLTLSSLTSGKNYDVFAYWTGSAVALELSSSWTSDTARNDALTTQDGVYVKSGSLGRRYLGTIRTTASDKTQDTARQRFVWNMDNRVDRSMTTYDTTDGWSNAGNGTWSNVNSGNAAWLHEFVMGLAEEPVHTVATVWATYPYVIAIRDDTNASPERTKTTFGLGSNSSATSSNNSAYYSAWPQSPGYHFVQALETTWNASTASVAGDNGGGAGGGNVAINSGMSTRIRG